MTVHDSSGGRQRHRDTSEDDNFPGFVVAQNFAKAWFDAVQAHAEHANQFWADVRHGEFSSDKALQQCARVVERYADALRVVVQPSRQPGRPEWLFIPYSIDEPTAPSQAVRVADMPTSQSHLARTPFRALNGDPVPDGVLSKEPTIEGAKVAFRLNADTLAKIPRGTTLVSLIYNSGHGPAAPMAIVVIHILD